MNPLDEEKQQARVIDRLTAIALQRSQEALQRQQEQERKEAEEEQRQISIEMSHAENRRDLAEGIEMDQRLSIGDEMGDLERQAIDLNGAAEEDIAM